MKLKLNADNSKIILVESTKAELNQLKLFLTRKVKNYRFSPRFKLGLWNGDIDYFKDGFMDFGLWNEVYKCCRQYGYPFIIQNQDQFPINKDITKDTIKDFVADFYKDHKQQDGITPFVPHDHQVDSIYQMLKYNFGVLEVATAGGKSLIFGTMLFYYLKHVNPKAKFLLIVPNVGLVTQFYNDLSDYNYGFKDENQTPLDIRIDEIMSDKPRKYRGEVEPNVYIGTYQSLEKWPREWFRQFDVVATDEAHKAKAVTLIAILSRTFGSAKIRFGMSGTYPSENTAEFLVIESLMGPKLINISAKSLIEKGLISDVKIKAILLQHENRSFAQGVYNIRKNGDGQRAFQLEREYIHNSAKRKKFIKVLIDKFTQNSLLLFHTIEYGNDLYNFLRDNCQDKDIYYIDGSTSGEKRDYIKKQMEITSGNPKILIASFGTFSTGQNVRSITNIIFADSFKSDSIIRQSIGRGLRLHAEKSKLVIFDLVDVFHPDFTTILMKHYESRRDEIYKKQKFKYDEMKVRL